MNTERKRGDYLLTLEGKWIGLVSSIVRLSFYAGAVLLAPIQ